MKSQICAGLALLALGGCVDVEPTNRAGLWHPTGVNARNMTAMAAQPYDLVRGRGDAGASGSSAAAAVVRLQEGRIKPLLGVSSGGNLGAPSTDAAAGPAPGS